MNYTIVDFTNKRDFGNGIHNGVGNSTEHRGKVKAEKTIKLVTPHMKASKHTLWLVAGGIVSPLFRTDEDIEMHPI